MSAAPKVRFSIFGAVLALLVGAGCSKPQTEASDRKTETKIGGAADTGASAAAGVQRYEDETPLDHRPLVATGYASVIAAVPKGAARSALNKGDAAVALATYDGFYLVSDETTKVLGWVAHFAFETRRDSLDKTALIPKCAPPTLLVSATRTIAASCAYECANARECGDDATCEAAIVLDVNGLVTLPEMYTTACHSTSDAGAQNGAPDGTKHATVPSLFGAAHGMDGNCAKGFAPALDYGKLCYRTCVADRDCPASASCKKTKGASLCFAN